MRRAAKIDATHAEVRETLEAFGCRVKSTASLGDGFPDLLVQKQGRLYLVEVKAGQGTLRPAQVAFQQAGWPVVVLRSAEEAEQWIRG